MFEKLEAMKERFDEITSQMANPSATTDISVYKDLAKERSSLERIVQCYERYKSAKEELSDVREMLEREREKEMVDFLKSEEEKLSRLTEELSRKLKLLLLPPEEYADRDVIVEIRAGTGGEEAALFAGDLFRMYSKYAEKQNWRMEVLSSNPSDMGGFKEVIFSLEGRGVYPRIKYESGVHRVQRVPVTESGGRIHTSTATVAVLPEPSEVDIQINPSDLRIDVFRSSGPGGQSVNTTDSAVRVTHIPSGIIVSCQDEKSQLQNKEKAMRILKARLLEAARKEQAEKEALKRRMQVGSGERSEKIRTYNFPQGRVTDHRIGLTLHKLDEVLEGDLEEIIEALAVEEKSRLLREVGES
ncbi:MAG: peptide chain release factor 1 [Actinomycetota bacterium]|nr:peptide chain release factor 1 [Actinomycetota bacterium]